jgi:hypothetical protein
MRIITIRIQHLSLRIVSIQLSEWLLGKEGAEVMAEFGMWLWRRLEAGFTRRMAGCLLKDK